MSNHPNRKPGHRGQTPAPDDIRAAREAAGLTQAEAARVIYATQRAWQNWETAAGEREHRRMHPAFFELFKIKAGLMNGTDVERGA